jgi:hypothetical protein
MKSDTEKLAEIAKWCQLWLDGDTDPRHTRELIQGIRNIAGAPPKIIDLVPEQARIA